ncbi:unnamed protein product [Heterobilharzia americana]|nr:unnamed protein product [Heterobilharzia americana]
MIMMSIFVTIPNSVENLDTLCYRLESYYGVSVSLIGDKLRIHGTSDKLNTAQDYALRFIGPESVSVIAMSSADCVELFNGNLTLIRHFESTYNVVLIKNDATVIVKGCALANKRFSKVLRSLESFSEVKCTYLSELKVSVLKSLCEKYLVKFDDLQCSDPMKLALLDYFTSLDKPGEISNGCCIDSPIENVHFVEAYRNSSGSLQFLDHGRKSNSSSSLTKSSSMRTRLRPIIIDGSNGALRKLQYSSYYYHHLYHLCA